MLRNLLLPLAFAASLPAAAAFMNIANFDTLANGNVNGQGGLVSAGDILNTAFQVVADPTGGTNKALQVNGIIAGSERLYHHAPGQGIANSARGTFFTRFLYTGAGDMNFGLSDVSAPSHNFNAFEVQFGAANVNASTGMFNLSARDGASQTALTGSLHLNQWYSLWALIDNTTDRYSVFIDGPGQTGQTQLFSAANPLRGEFAFRNSGTSLQSTALDTILIRRNNYYLDDISFNSTSFDLSNPTVSNAQNFIPEPGLLTPVAAAAALLRRR